MMYDAREVPALAERLDFLFRRRRSGGRRWTNDEVAAQIKSRNPELRVSGAYLSALRTGKRARPSSELLIALAEFFGVSPAYFFEREVADRVTTQLAALDEFKQSGVRALALRADGLPKESLDLVSVILDQLRKKQGLPPVTESTEEDRE